MDADFSLHGRTRRALCNLSPIPKSSINGKFNDRNGFINSKAFLLTLNNLAARPYFGWQRAARLR
jgi:hypothetical protein